MGKFQIHIPCVGVEHSHSITTLFSYADRSDTFHLLMVGAVKYGAEMMRTPLTYGHVNFHETFRGYKYNKTKRNVSCSMLYFNNNNIFS